MNRNLKTVQFAVIVLVIIFVGITAWDSFFKTYAQKDTVDVHQFPKIIQGWISEEIPLSDVEYQILETRNAFVRKYISPSGQEVMLYIVYSQTNRKVAHPPELCFSGGGSTAVSKKKVHLTTKDKQRTILANRFLFDRMAYQELMYYWFKIGDSTTENYLKQQFLIALKTFLGKPSSSALIRLTTIVHGQNVAIADKNILEFSNAIIPLLPKYVP